jgi:hypothetical protein
VLSRFSRISTASKRVPRRTFVPISPSVSRYSPPNGVDGKAFPPLTPGPVAVNPTQRATMTKKDYPSKHAAAGTSKTATQRLHDRIMPSSESGSRRAPLYLLTKKKDL